jgi:ArsR family transcriptional regulator
MFMSAIVHASAIGRLSMAAILDGRPIHCSMDFHVAKLRNSGNTITMTSDRQRYEIHAAVFAALANPTRHEIMHLLCEEPRTPSELADELQVSRPNVSQHISVLQREGLVRRYRLDGRVLWEVVDKRLSEACRLIDEIVGREAADKAHILESHEERIA